MNILFLTISSIEDIKQRGIYTDLIRELSIKGINMYVVSAREKRTNLPTEISSRNNIHQLKIRTGNITKNKNLIEKGIATISVEYLYLKEINKYFKDVKFDVILYSTPPITFNRVVKHFKIKHGAITYLMLKDIFPQNAVDIRLMKKGSLIWKYFRRKEIQLYNNSDIIGCMSKANKEYILKKNSEIDPNKVEIFPNSISPINLDDLNKLGQLTIENLKIPKDKIVFLYGGNLGKPQGIDFVIDVIERFDEVTNGYLVIVGGGTEYKLIENVLSQNRKLNVRLIPKLPKHEYDELVKFADIGLIFLDKRFTIPNIPSRLTSYMENQLAVLAATDPNTDLKDILREAGCGLWVESGDINGFINCAKELSINRERVLNMGKAGRRYLEINFNIVDNVDILLKHFCDN